MGDNEILGRRLVQLRSEKRLTQLELARKAGLTPAAISHFETGFRYPTAATLAKLAEALEVDVDYLMGRADAPTPNGPQFRAIFRNAQGLSEDALSELERFSEFLKKHDEAKKDPDAET
jgi:transcriptional regulator with XRE-family HTH domain